MPYNSEKTDESNYTFHKISKITTVINVLFLLISSDGFCRIGTGRSLVQHLNYFSIFETYELSKREYSPPLSLVGAGGSLLVKDQAGLEKLLQERKYINPISSEPHPVLRVVEQQRSNYTYPSSGFRVGALQETYIEPYGKIGTKIINESIPRLNNYSPKNNIEKDFAFLHDNFNMRRPYGHVFIPETRPILESKFIPPHQTEPSDKTKSGSLTEFFLGLVLWNNKRKIK